MITRLLVIAVVSFIAGRAVAVDPPIVLGMNEWHPFFVRGTDGTYSGMGVDKLSQLFFAMGKRIVVRAYPYPRAVSSAMTGETDGIALISYNRERERALMFSDPLFCERYELFFRKGESVDWTVPSNIAGRRIIVVKGFTYHAAVNDLMNSASLVKVEASDPTRVFPMLVGRRADMVVFSLSEARALIRTDPTMADQIEPAEKPLSVLKLNLALSRKRHTPGFLDRVNDTIRRLGIGGKC